MNNRNINVAARPQTILTARRIAQAARVHRRNYFQADAFERHLKSFANPNVCYVSANGISMPVCLS